MDENDARRVLNDSSRVDDGDATLIWKTTLHFGCTGFTTAGDPCSSLPIMQESLRPVEHKTGGTLWRLTIAAELPEFKFPRYSINNSNAAKESYTGSCKA